MTDTGGQHQTIVWQDNEHGHFYYKNVVSVSSQKKTTNNNKKSLASRRRVPSFIENACLQLIFSQGKEICK